MVSVKSKKVILVVKGHPCDLYAWEFSLGIARVIIPTTATKCAPMTSYTRRHAAG